MIDRAARDALLVALEDCRQGNVPVSGFCERICEIEERTQDETVRHCTDELWFFYEDCKDDPEIDQAVAEKAVWEVWDRMRQLLMSNGELAVEPPDRRRHWLVSVCGLACLAVFALWMWQSGGVWFALGMYLLLGVVITWLIRRRCAAIDKKNAPDGTKPFVSREQMRRAIRNVPGYYDSLKAGGSQAQEALGNRITSEVALFLFVPIVFCMKTGYSVEARQFFQGE